MASDHHGVVYTKRWVVDMVLDLAGYISGTGIVDKVIIEPSCGCGAFMEAIAERLADEITCAKRPWLDLLESVRSYDIDLGSIAETKRAVIDALVKKGCLKSDAFLIADEWLICEDFILGKAPSCDFIVGNPPYIRATEIDRKKRELYCRSLPSVTSGCDLYVSFFDRGIDLLKKDGSLCYICADRWLQNTYGRNLRQRVGDECNLSALVRMHGVDAFDDNVDAYPAVTLIERGSARGDIRFVNCSEDFKPENVDSVMEWLGNPSEPIRTERYEAFMIGRPQNSDVYLLGDSELVGFVARAREKLPNLEEADVKLGIGVATGCDSVFLTEEEDLVEPERMLPIFYMRDYRRGYVGRRRWLVNPWASDGSLVDLDIYPRLKSYFEGHRERLLKRHVAKKNASAWYRTIDKLTPGLVDRELLLMPDMAAQPDPILTQGIYPHHNCYWIASDTWDLRVLGGLLMADTTRCFIDALGVKMRGGTLRFQAQYLRLVHIPEYAKIDEKIREGLSKAFEEKDRKAATRYAKAAYEEAMR